MPREWKRKTEDKSDDSKSRNSDRKQSDDPVEFKDVCDPVRLNKPGDKAFVEISRRQTVGVKDGKVRTEFIGIVPGYFEKEKGEARYLPKSPTWPPSMTKQIVEAIESMVSDEEAKMFGWVE